ncbi:MAG: hypothetical protein ACLVAW_07465 [Eisenbergiella massiliensis]
MKAAGRRRLAAGFLAAVLMLTVPAIGANATSDTREKLERQTGKAGDGKPENAAETNIDNMEEVQTGLKGS